MQVLPIVCQTGLRQVEMPYSDMWRGCQATFRHSAAPSWAFSPPTSKINVQTSTRSFAHQVDWSAPSRQRSQSDSHSGDRLYRSRSLDGDATVQADFTLTTTSRLRRPTGVISHHEVYRMHVHGPIAAVNDATLRRRRRKCRPTGAC